MINFILKKISEDSPHYNLTFMKLVHKRNGEVVEENGDTIYGIPLTEVKNRIVHVELSTRLNNVSLNEYIIEFQKYYKEVCELLKKTL